MQSAKILRYHDGRFELGRECQALIEEFLSVRAFGGDGMVMISKPRKKLRGLRDTCPWRLLADAIRRNTNQEQN